MQHVDRPAQVELLAEPVRPERPRVDSHALSHMPGAQSSHSIGRYWGRRRYFRQLSAVWAPEAERPIRPALDGVAHLVNGSMMPMTEQREIGQRRRSAVRPMAQMMPLREAMVAAGEAAPAVPILERTPERGRKRPCPRPYFLHAPIRAMPHDHAGGVARQAARRFRGNARALLED